MFLIFCISIIFLKLLVQLKIKQFLSDFLGVVTLHKKRKKNNLIIKQRIIFFIAVFYSEFTHLESF